MPCEAEGFRCDDAFLGQYQLNQSQLARIKKQRDYRPDDKERDSVLEKTINWLMDSGFSKLTYKTQYFETQPL